MRRRSLLTFALTLAAGPLLALAAPGIRAADEGQIAYSRKEGDKYLIHVMKADGTGDKLLGGQTGNNYMFPVWSPDGKQIACMTGDKLQGNEFQVVILNADGSGAKVWNIPQKLAGLPAWSPDGKQIAFIAGENEPNVYVADADGNGMRQLNPEGSIAFFPFWTPDGKAVCYSKAMRQDEMKSEIVRQPVDGSAAETLVAQKDGLMFSSANGLSPDGKRLLYVVLAFQDKKASVRMWDMEAKSESFLDEMEVKEMDGPQGFPVAGWAPDGKSYLVSRPTEKGYAIFRISDDGKTKTRLTPEGVDCVGPACSK